MFKQKFKASLTHFSVCVATAAIVLAIIYLGWYQGVLAMTQGIGAILLIVLGIDVVLGPLLTFFVYKPGKKTLVFDLSVIALVQVSFLAYGLYIIEHARPVYLVYSTDRFEPVAIADFDDKQKLALSKAPAAVSRQALFAPRVIAAAAPTDSNERADIGINAMNGGPKLAQLPKYYVEYAAQQALAATKARTIEDLKELNPTELERIDQVVAHHSQRAKVALQQIGFLPLSGKERDAVVLLNNKTGEVLGYELFRPWL
jgi:hypothetical protein